MLSVGIDYDAAGWKVALWDEEHAADLHAFAHAPDLWEFLDEVRRRHPAAPAVLPSGLGVPVTRAGELLDQDILDMTLGGDPPTPDGLGAFLAEARRRLPRAFCIPAVKLLPTIPPYRKRHRIDLGAADVLCAATWILHCRAGAARAQASGTFLLVCAGSARRALVAVVGGRIVDGIGGSAPALGTPSRHERRAALDRARPGFPAGRPSSAAGFPSPAAAWETLTKEAHGLVGFHSLPEVLVIGDRRREAAEALGSRLPMAAPSAPVDGYEAALGAAVIAAGLTGGPTAALLDRLGLRETRERVLDWLTP
jgi:predicted butyrate kinase (DUF1464 family)